MPPVTLVPSMPASLRMESALADRPPILQWAISIWPLTCSRTFSTPVPFSSSESGIIDTAVEQTYQLGNAHFSNGGFLFCLGGLGIGDPTELFVVD